MNCVNEVNLHLYTPVGAALLSAPTVHLPAQDGTVSDVILQLLVHSRPACTLISRTREQMQQIFVLVISPILHDCGLTHFYRNMQPRDTFIF